MAAAEENGCLDPAENENLEKISLKPAATSEDSIDAKSCFPTKELIDKNGFGKPTENLENKLGSGDETDAKPAVIGDNVVPGAKVPTPFTDKDSLHYNIKGCKKVIVFNHRKFQSRFQLNERKGTELDVAAIKSTFKCLKWEVEVHNDSGINDIRSVMTSLQVGEETENLAALAIFILSHGEDNGTVFATDSMYRVDHDILFQLTADKCPFLAGKPKLIFVQACQGQSTDPGMNVRRRHTSQDSTSTYKIPNFADFLVFQASFWNHYSFRSSDTGSWFIQALCSKIGESEDKDSLYDILTEVSRSVSIEKESNVPNKPHLHQKKQTPLLYSTLLRKIYLKGSGDERRSTKLSCSVPAVPSRAERSDNSKSSNKQNCRVM